MIPSQFIPKYKALAFIRTDVWNTLKTKKLNKKKWRILISLLKRRKYKRKPEIMNYSAKTVSKFPVYFRYKYQKNLIIRTKMKLIYGSLQDYKIKDLAKKGGLQSFTQSLEQKAPFFLYRLGLTSTYGEAKIHYIHKRIIVNGSYQELYIKKGDVLHFNSHFEKLLKRRIMTGFSKRPRRLKLVGHNKIGRAHV